MGTGRVPWLSTAALTGAAGTAMAWRIRRMTGGLRGRAVLAEAVAELSHQALGAEQPDELLREALRVAVEVTGADYGTAVRRLPDGRMRVAEELGTSPVPPGTILPIAPRRSYVLRVVETGRPVLSADLRADPRVTPPLPLLERGVVSGLAVPVRGAREVLGVLALHSRRRNRFRDDDVALASALASVVATAWEQVTQRERLGHQALHDPLTGLANRSVFFDRLEHALVRRPSGGARAGQPGLAVAIIDLDDFKGVNDGFGHAAGDHILTVTARRLAEVVRRHDTIARLGGDEFALLCDPVADEAGVVALVQRLQAAAAGPVAVAGSSLRVSASAGISWTGRTPGAVSSGAELLAEADAALYRAKEHGRGRVQVFDDRLRSSARRRRQVETELQEALARDEFRLHYQPVRRSDDLRVVGVEALLRWQHPSRGLLAPDQFVPVAERAGLLVPIGRWVLRTACRRAALWQQAAAATDPPLWVAVNVSPRQLDDRRFPEAVAGALEATGLAEGTLALELTESALLAGDDHHRDALTGLRETGARVFLDDFGTGYSSLTHLTQLPIHGVKIDKSFVAGLPGNRRHAAVVSSLVSLSGDLGLDVVAEGVETARQLGALRRMQCRTIQGYLFDRPAAEPAMGPAALPAEVLPGPGRRG